MLMYQITRKMNHQIADDLAQRRAAAAQMTGDGLAGQ
jgi:hypothetical protein